MHKILVVNFPPFHLDDMIDDYLRVFAKDKKIGNNIVCILSSRKGAMKKVQIPFDDKLRAWYSHISAPECNLESW